MKEFPTQRAYREFLVPKKSGGERSISAPSEALAFVQRQLNDLLSELYLPPLTVHGFVAGRSIITNAICHSDARCLLNIDISSFFDSVFEEEVVHALQDSPIGASADTARAIASLCTYQGSLPQGAPSSPVLSNIFLGPFDLTMERLAATYGCVYSRYADDISLSTHHEQFPEELAVALRGNPTAIAIAPPLQEVFGRHHLSINYSKVRLAFRGRDALEVTGLRIGTNLDVRKRIVARTEAMLRMLSKFGIERCEVEHRTRGLRGDFMSALRGAVAYVGHVRGAGNTQFRQWTYTLGMTTEGSSASEAEFWLKHLSDLSREYSDQSQESKRRSVLREVPAVPGERVFLRSSLLGQRVIVGQIARLKGVSTIVSESETLHEDGSPVIDSRGQLLGIVRGLTSVLSREGPSQSRI